MNSFTRARLAICNQIWNWDCTSKLQFYILKFILITLIKFKIIQIDDNVIPSQFTLGSTTKKDSAL